MKPSHSWLGPFILGISLIALVPFPLTACSLCGNTSQDTLGGEFERAKLVLYGRAVASELSGPGAPPGSGRTEFRIDRVLKDDPALTDKKGLYLGRYLPVSDPKDPPRYLVFCAVDRGKFDAYLGKAVRSDAVVAYLEGAQQPRNQGRVQALQYYFNFLDNDDDVIACDAMLEFARSNDQDVNEVRRLLKADRLRALLQSPRTKSEHLGLLGFLLGGCGEAKDADELLAMIQRTDDASRKARDGLLAGYLTMKPREGWQLVRSQLADVDRPIPDRFRAINALRLCYNLKLGEYRQEALRCFEVMIPQADLADFAVEDLRQWAIWDLTELVLAQYGKESHAAPITRRAIVRYAMCCPRPEARQFVERVQVQDAETYRLVKQGLDFEKEAESGVRTPAQR